jgi:disulfide oxidoreductase YuzD
MPKTVQELVNRAAVYIQFGEEAFRIDYADDENQRFFGSYEESGEEHSIEYDEVDLENDMFYELVVIDPNN